MQWEPEGRRPSGSPRERPKGLCKPSMGAGMKATPHRLRACAARRRVETLVLPGTNGWFGGATPLRSYPRIAIATPDSVSPSDAASRQPNGSPRNAAALATPTTGVTSVPSEASDAGSRRSAANQDR